MGLAGALFAVAGHKASWKAPVWAGRSPAGGGAATFLEGFGSELALRAGPAEGQEGTEGSLNPAWVGSRMWSDSAWLPVGTPVPPRGPSRLTISWGHLSAATVAILRTTEQGFAGTVGRKCWVTPTPKAPGIAGAEGQRAGGGEFGDRDGSQGLDRGRQRSLPVEDSGEAWGDDGPWWATHVHTHRHACKQACTCTHMETGLELEFWGHTRKQGPAPQLSSSLPGPPHLLGLGRGLGR